MLYQTHAEADTPTGTIPLSLQSVPRGDHAEELCFQIMADANLSVSRYRVVFQWRFPEGAPVRVHHQAFPRLHRSMTLPATESLGSANYPRSTEGNISVERV